MNNGIFSYRNIWRRLIAVLCTGSWLGALTSCTGIPVLSHREQCVDSLNRLAYEYRYRNTDRSLSYAQQAQTLAEAYSDGMAEALNHMAYVKYQRMDFDGAEQLVQTVQKTTGNQVELLIADVMGMKICQRISGNHDFFIYRNRAQQRLERIAEEEERLSAHLRDRLLFARAEYHIVSSTYYFYLEQEGPALAEINRVKPETNGRRDTAQWLYLNYMKGSGGLCEGSNEEEIRFREFDYLFKCYTLSKSADYIYFEGNCLQAFAILLQNREVRMLLKNGRQGAYEYLYGQHLSWLPEGEPREEDLPLALTSHALHLFQEYKDWFQTACTYRTLGEIMFRRKDYETALRYFQTALGYVNRHHQRYYPSSASDTLCAYKAEDTISVEMQWMLHPEIKTVPEWIAGIRENMSMVYSALGEKQASDYNRNIYLDLLELTRQDKEWESRYEELNEDTRLLTFGLTAVVTLILLVAILVVCLSFRWRKNTRKQINELRAVLEHCRHILAGTEKEEENHMIFASGTWNAIIQPYQDFARSNRQRLRMIGAEQLRAQDAQRLIERHIIGNKRHNIEKRAKMSLAHAVIPFLDRIIHEVHRLKNPDKKTGNRLQYIRELIDQINTYNAILTQWIQLHQGQLDLHVENFELRPLFELLKKGRYAFEQKGIGLHIEDTESVVKADRALTLFMINTLADNARKFTPSGGTVTVSAREHEAYVEISVADTGCGLSEDDIQLILSSKVYDSHKIGCHTIDADRSKGSGFGLMNCKGIIEKYRKTNSLFEVCLFGIESRLGTGSRFYFRLPKAIRHSIQYILIGVMWLFCSCHANPFATESKEARLAEPTATHTEENMQYAQSYVDSLYFANIRGAYSQALSYADSAFHYVNLSQKKRYGTAFHEMVSYEPDKMAVPAEIAWWNNRYETDYNLLLALRNETAVAALALHDWSLYRYNNHAYKQLYRLLSQDASLEFYCKEMEKAQTDKRISLALIVLLTIAASFVYYLFYVRERLQFRFRLRQVLEVNQSLLTTASACSETEDISDSAKKLLACVRHGLNELHTVTHMQMLLYDEERNLVGYYSEGNEYYVQPEDKEWLTGTYRSAHPSVDQTKCRYTFPLWLEKSDDHLLCIGALLIDTGKEMAGEAERLMDELVVRYLAVLLYQSVLCRQAAYDELDSAENEYVRARYEEERLHVQNMILDNCLSAIKHESIYYPNRIRMSVERLSEIQGKKEEWDRQMTSLTEWTDYYKEVYTLLCSQADRQLAEIKFRRKAVSVEDLLKQSERFFIKQCSKKALSCQLRIDWNHPFTDVLGDEDLLQYLLENLIAAALNEKAPDRPTTFCLSAKEDGRFVRFQFIDKQPNCTKEEVDEWFIPDARRIPYLICKQIIREHDTFTNHCGCRIQAELLPDGSFCIGFTIPQYTQLICL